MTVSEEQLETIGRLVDKCEHLLGAAELPLPPHIHISGMTAGLQQCRDSLKELFFEMGGDKDTWG
jgi:hypothetical protein